MAKKKTFYSRLVNFLSRFLKTFIRKLTAAQKFIDYEKYMLEFGYREDDIYIVTYPKSGTTLCQMVLYQMLTDGNMNFHHIYDVSPWTRNDAHLGIPPRNLSGRRIIKSHDYYKLIPPDFKGKIIYVYRDGMDVAASMYHQEKNYVNPNLSFDDFLKDYFKKDNMNWFEFNENWLTNKKKLDILYVSYSELTKDKKRTIERIADFCKIDINLVDMDRVLERSSFEFMKEHEDKFGETRPKEFVYDEFIRKGETGKGKEYFNKNQTQFFQAAYEASIRKLLESKHLIDV